MLYYRNIFQERLVSMTKKKRKKKLNKEFIKNQIIAPVVSSLLTTVILYIFGHVFGFLSLPREVSELTIRIEALEESNKNSNNSKKLETTINNYYGAHLTPTDKGEPKIVSISPEYACLLLPPPWSKSDVIATNTATNEKYTAAQLSNEKILLRYKIDGQDCFFGVQFNEDNQWDGECIVNIYKNNKLITIMESIYDNGELLSYKQAMVTTTKSGEKVWSIGKRKREIEGNEEYNTGETWNYSYVDLNQDFSFENATLDCIFDIDKFEDFLKEKTFMEGYYSGRTSNGEYNDNTGDAYLVKYFKPNIIHSDNKTPVIRTLYKGKFVNGDFEDDTYNAWYITRETNTTYMYYKGCFLDGNVKHKNNDKEEFENYLTHEKIDNYLKKYGFTQYSTGFIVDY